MKSQLDPITWLLTLLVISSAPYVALAHYDASLQRWLNRDPLSERGFELLRAVELPTSVAGPNLYAYLDNAPIEFVDPFGLEKEPACANQCYADLGDCYSVANIVEFGFGGGAIGAGLQGLNKTATVPGKGRLLGGTAPSGDYTSWTRKSFGRAGRATGRVSVRGAGAVGAAVGMLALHAKCLSAFAGCMSGCPNKPCRPLGPPIPPGPPNSYRNAPPPFLTFP